jgi:hypothetical protein
VQIAAPVPEVRDTPLYVVKGMVLNSLKVSSVEKET